ncbi:hypothetical protein EDB19DRAFT_1803157, partial [Suillus lakei]
FWHHASRPSTSSPTSPFFLRAWLLLYLLPYLRPKSLSGILLGSFSAYLPLQLTSSPTTRARSLARSCILLDTLPLLVL